MVDLLQWLRARIGPVGLVALAAVGASALGLVAALLGLTLGGAAGYGVVLVAAALVPGSVAAPLAWLAQRPPCPQSPTGESPRTEDGQEVLGRDAFEEAASNEILRAHRYAFPVSLVLVRGHRTEHTDASSLGDTDPQRAVARLLVHTLRQSDLVGRYRGHTFALLLPHTNAETAAQLAVRLGHHVRSLGLETRLGVAGLRADESLAALFRRAEASLDRGSG